MRNMIKNTAVAASLLAALALAGSSAHGEPSMDRSSSVQVEGGAGGKHFAKEEGRKGGWRGGRKGGGALLGAFLDLGYAHIEDSTTHYGETCLYIGGCKISVVQDPDAPPAKPKVEIRKKAPRPIRHVTDKRTGWTYYLAQDRNTGEDFIQIEDANGADVHINGEVPMPGGGPTYQVR
jgi:hypothetical protein